MSNKNHKRPIQVSQKPAVPAAGVQAPEQVDETAIQEGEAKPLETLLEEIDNDPGAFVDSLEESLNGEAIEVVEEEEPAPPSDPVITQVVATDSGENEWTIRTSTIRPPETSKVPPAVPVPVAIRPVVEKKESVVEKKSEKAEPAEKVPTIVVYPMVTQNRVRIGPNYYQFTARKAVRVPKAILGILVEKGICSPPPEEIAE